MSKNIQLEATGERFVKSFDGIISLEHWHRYYLVKSLVKNKTVLDIASGEGYGSHLLSDVANYVIGVDISHDAVDFATQSYHRDNLEYKQGDCCKIPLADHSVDVVVSFETIEHHDKHDQMVSEIKRVLKPDGLLIMSSPDRHEYNDVPGYNNPHHVKELYTQEFTNLLSKYFSNIELADQRVVVGSLIVPRKDSIGFDSLITDTSEPDGVDWNGGFTRGVFNLALASNSSLPSIKTTITEFSVEKAKDVIFSDLINKQKIKDQETKLISLEKAISYKDKTLSDKENSLCVALNEIEVLNETIANIHASKAWKIIIGYRKLINYFRG